MSGYAVIEIKRENLFLWVLQFRLGHLNFPFDLLEFRDLGMCILSLKHSFKRSLKQQLSNLVFPYRQLSSYRSVYLIRCKTMMKALVRRARGRKEHACW